MPRLRILISAYSCEPGRGSEPGVGWNLVREIANHHNVWVLTRPDESKTKIEAELEKNPVPGLKFIYFTLPFWLDSRKWGQSGAMQIHYYLWQIQAYFVARRLHAEINFDLIHHVTFVKYSTPSFLSLLPVPFIWGPVGGGESAPKPFWQDFSPRAWAYEIARSTARGIGERDPFVGMTARKSALIQATTEDTVDRIRKMGATKIEIQPESGLSETDIQLLSQLPPPPDQPVRFISMGRLLHWKGFHLGIRGFAAAQLPNAEYWICGEGPEMTTLKTLVCDLGIERQVKFWGYLQRDQVLQKLGQCHVLVHPSLHDSGGWVCPEAMAAGRPVVCLDLGGPGARVTSETGFKVPAHNPAQAVQDIAKAMQTLATDPDLRVRMGQAGQTHAQTHLTWTAKGKRLAALYDTLAAQPEAIPCAS